MIELIPAIDIINGQCVRLTKGDYDQKTVYGSPLDMALEFERIGYQRLHVVDLDGAKSKHIVNSPVLSQITTETKLTVDFGGGIKTDEDIEVAFNHGASMVTIGSIAVTDRNQLHTGHAVCDIASMLITKTSDSNHTHLKLFHSVSPFLIL